MPWPIEAIGVRHELRRWLRRKYLGVINNEPQLFTSQVIDWMARLSFLVARSRAPLASGTRSVIGS